MKKSLLTTLFLSLFFLIFVPLVNTQAIEPSGVPDPISPSNNPCPAGSTNCLTNPLGSINTPQQLIGKIINAVLGVVGSLALLMFVYGGLTWMTSSGSQEKVKKGRDIIVWSAIGLAIIFASYGLVRILLNSVK